jgi:hypothetical protein
VSFSIIAARADAVFSIKEELPQRVDVGASPGHRGEAELGIVLRIPREGMIAAEI